MALLAVPCVRLLPRVGVAHFGVTKRHKKSTITRASFVDQPGDDAGPATSTKLKPEFIADGSETRSIDDDDDDDAYVESEEELTERLAVGALVRWCVERGASGSGLSVRLPDDKHCGRGLEASRDIEKDTTVLRMPLDMGICDQQEGHPTDAWETMQSAPWGVRLACRVLQERAKGIDSEYAPYLQLVPTKVPGSPLLWDEADVLGLQYPPAVAEAREMRAAVLKWHGILVDKCPSALGNNLNYATFAEAVSVVHSRTYGVASAETNKKSEGYFRALLPLADLLNHGGDEYPASAGFLSGREFDTETAAAGSTSNANDTIKSVGNDTKSNATATNKMWPPSQVTDTVSWSTVDDAGVIEFAATKAMRCGTEATMSYGERSNDHFLMYYGFAPLRNCHDDVVVFADIEHALSWHMVFHPEVWDGVGFLGDQTASAREEAARSAVRATENLLATTKDGALVASEPRMKVLTGGRCDARLVSLFAGAYAGNGDGVVGGKEMLAVDIKSAKLDIAKRCAELLRQMPTTVARDCEILHGDALSDATRAAVSYRCHKKEVLQDAIRELGSGGGVMPEAVYGEGR